MSAAHPNSVDFRFPPVPGAVHAVVAENPGEIARLVLDFLGTMPAAPSPP